MKLKNILIVVDNIEESIHFYNELFGLNVISRQEGNVIMSEGLVKVFFAVSRAISALKL